MYLHLMSDAQFHQNFVLLQDELTFLEDFEGEDDRLTDADVARLNAEEI